MFNPPPRVTCHVSCVMCIVSCVTCQASHVRCHKSGVMCNGLFSPTRPHWAELVSKSPCPWLFMSVCLCHRETTPSGGRVDLWSKIAFMILVWDDTIFQKTGGPIFGEIVKTPLQNRGLSLALRSHDQIPASHWYTPQKIFKDFGEN